ncbi:MAG TPA: hypothetical protein VIU11_15010 [Nakamurella sp.]
MTTTRRLALAAGVSYLLTFAFSIPAYFLYEPVLTDPPTSPAAVAPTPGSSSVPSSRCSPRSRASGPPWRCTG